MTIFQFPSNSYPQIIAHTLLRLFLLLSISSITDGCGPTSISNPVVGASISPTTPSDSQTTTCLNIVDGQATSAFPATYMILFLNPHTGQVQEQCTGTFISDNTMITAAHCIPLGGAQDFLLVSNQQKIAKNQSVITNAIHAIKTFVDPSIPTTTDGGGRDLGQGQSMALDIGIVMFPDNTASSFIPLATATAPSGTAVTLVGYGDGNALNPSTTASFTQKASGTNVISPSIAQFSENGVYTTLAWGQPGEAAAHGQNTVSGAPGDSGGPLLVGSTMIGIVSRGATSNEIPNLVQMVGTDTINFFVDLTNSTATSLLTQAKAAGAHINYATTAPATTTGTANTSAVGTSTTSSTSASPSQPATTTSSSCH